MGLVIINVSEEYLSHGKVGVQTYEVRINSTPLTRFDHNTEDGMAKCFKLAGEALDKIDIDAVISKHIEDFHKRQREIIAEIIRNRQNSEVDI